MDYQSAVDFISKKTDLKPTLGFILGSGLGAFADEIEDKVVIAFADIPGFKRPHVDGHSGELVIGKIGKTNVAVLKGRIHFYEGHSTSEVVFPIRVLKKLGVEILVVTNSSGGLKKTAKPGDFMIITDHINLTGQNPLVGKNQSEFGPRFPDMTEAYDKKLSKILESVLKKLKIRHYKGIYCGVLGPCYETPAEVRHLQQIGGGAVGMSTVLEVIAAKHAQMKVVGLSCVTNPGAGILNKPLNHEEVTLAAQKAQKNFIKTLIHFSKNI